LASLGSRPRLGRSLCQVIGYSGVCYEIKFSGRHRGFDGVLFNLSPLAARETVVIGRAGYISWHKVSPLPIPPLALYTPLYKERSRNNYTLHYTHHQVSLMVSRNTTLVPSLGLRTGPACEAGLSAGMQRERVQPRIRKKEKERKSY